MCVSFHTLLREYGARGLQVVVKNFVSGTPVLVWFRMRWISEIFRRIDSLAVVGREESYEEEEDSDRWSGVVWNPLML